jgi:purine nucleosidase
MMAFFEQAGNRQHATTKRPLHDAIAMAWLLWPELFRGRLCNVEIETSSPLTLGATVVDWLGRTQRPRNCLWITRCNATTLYARMLDRLARLPHH